MNHTQKKYAQERVEQLRRQHEGKIESDGKDRRRPEVTTELRLRMIREGAAILHPERAYPSGRYREAPELFEMFDFPGEVEIKEHNERVAEEVSERLAVLRAAAGDLRDDLMLGDAAEALAKLKEFAAKSF